MNLSPNARLALDPQLRLRNDVDRAILITRSFPLVDRAEFCHYLHPTTAIILALFNGERTIADVEQLWAKLTDKEPEVGKQEVDHILDNYTNFDGKGSIFIDAENGKKAEIIQYDPQDFVIPKDQVNLSDFRFRRPYVIYFLPSLFCPQRCVYCYAKITPKPEPNLIGIERLREIFHELRTLGVDAIGLSGGDPLARRDIFEILKDMIDLGITPDVPTKVGLTFRRIQELQDLGIDMMQVSLDSSEPEIVDQVVGVKGYHKRVFRVMEDLRRAGMKVRTNSVLTPLNIHGVGALLDYLGHLGNVVRVNLTPYGRSLFCHSDKLFVDKSELAELRVQLQEKKKLYKHMKITLSSPTPTVPENEEKRQREWEERALCTGNRHGFILLPDGRVTVCEELYDHPSYIIGDLTKESVMEMWNSPEALALIHPDQAAVPDGACKTCSEFEECNAGLGRCWRDILKSYGWNKPHYPDPRCRLAPPGAQLS